jgi:prepilin-type N-terminal cleavage/methylation domain-containing protein
MMNLQRRRRGFSLIELLIVIAIILIIITIALPKFNSAQRYAKETAALDRKSTRLNSSHW